jgi:hypothetical protein
MWKWLKEGVPGWFWAALITSVALASWLFAGFGVAMFTQLWAESGTEFLMYAGGMVGLWLGVKTWKFMRKTQAEEENVDDDEV